MRQHLFPRVLCTSGKEKEYKTCRYKGERRTLNIRVPSQLFAPFTREWAGEARAAS